MKVLLEVACGAVADGSHTRCQAEISVDEFDDETQSRLRQLRWTLASLAADSITVETAPSSSPEEVPRRAPKNASPSQRTNRHSRSGSVRTATPKQISAINGIARRQGIDLVSVLKHRFDVTDPVELSIQDASILIGELRSSEAAAVG